MQDDPEVQVPQPRTFISDATGDASTHVSGEPDGHDAVIRSVMGSGLRLIARVVHVVVSVVVLVIVAGILLVMLKANRTNTIVSDVHGWAHSLAGPFDGMFSLHDARTAVAVNWGIAAVVYLFVGELIARVISSTRR